MGAFSKLGLTFICFQTNKRKHMYGKPVPSSRGGSSFCITVPAEQKLLGFRGQIGQSLAGASEELSPNGRAPTLGIQSLSPIFVRQYLDDAKVSAVTMGKGEDKVREKSRRKLNRVSGSRSANSSLGSVGSKPDKQNNGARNADQPDMSPLSQGNRHSERSAEYVKVARKWKHPIGNEIDGEFEGDRLNGRATFTWGSGDRFVGQVQDGIAHGWGVFTSKSGDTYNGSFEGGNMRGWGTMRFANGDQYEGAFENGQACGQGHMISNNGDRYVGNYSDGHACGQGIKMWSDGRKYSGEWKKGRHEGKGRLSWPDGSWCEGQWVKGQLHGKGVLINGHGDKYEGGWRWHQLHGAGTWTFASGVVFNGRWENGNIVAKGELAHLSDAASHYQLPQPETSSAAFVPHVHRDPSQDIEDLDALIRSNRRPPPPRGGERTGDGARGDGGRLRASSGTTSIAVPSGTHVLPSGSSPGGRDLAGAGNEWDVESCSSRASEFDDNSTSPGANARDPASWEVGGPGEVGGADGKGKEKAGKRPVQLMAGMPEAMASGVGVPASALLQAALQQVVGAGSAEEREQAQKAIRAGLVQLDADRRKRRLNSIRAPAAATRNGSQEGPRSGLSRVHDAVADLLQQHESQMQAVRQKHAHPPSAGRRRVADATARGAGGARAVDTAPNGGEHHSSRRVDRIGASSGGGTPGIGHGRGHSAGRGHAGLAFDDGELLDFLTHELPPLPSSTHGGGVVQQGFGVGLGGQGRDVDGVCKPDEDTADVRAVARQKEAALHGLVQQLQAADGFDGVGDADEKQRLQTLANMGHDVSVFQSSPADAGDRFGNDVDYVAGLLRRQVQMTESDRPFSQADADDAEEAWQAAISEGIGAAKKGKQAMERLKRELEEKRWAAVLAEAQAARLRDNEERKLRKELAVAAAEERTVRENEERRALLVQLEAEVLVEVETQRRAAEESRRLAQELQTRRARIAEQRKQRHAEQQPSSRDAMEFVERLCAALGSHFVAFQQSFRMSLGNDEEPVPKAHLAQALQALPFTPQVGWAGLGFCFFFLARARV